MSVLLKKQAGKQYSCSTSVLKAVTLAANGKENLQEALANSEQKNIVKRRMT